MGYSQPSESGARTSASETSPGTRVVVIGGTGFIGSHLVESLASAGYRVHVLSRHARWPWGGPPHGVELHRLDLANPSEEGRLAALLGGASAIVNLAGVLYRPGLPADSYWSVHVESAARLASAARSEGNGRLRQRRSDASEMGPVRSAGVRPGTEPASLDAEMQPAALDDPMQPAALDAEMQPAAVDDASGPVSGLVRPSRDRKDSGLGSRGVAGESRDLQWAAQERVACGEVHPVERTSLSSRPESTLRLVHVSTTGVLGPTGGVPRDESATPHPGTIYEETKLAGERAVLERRGDGLEVVVIRPGLVYGPRDLHLLGLYRSIASGTFRLIDGGRARWQPVYVEDVARALEAAIHAPPGCDGEIFHVAGAEPISVRQLAQRMAVKLGTRVRAPGLPYAIAMAAGSILEGIYRPLGLDPPLSRSRVRTLTEDRVYIIDRAREGLGFSPRIGLEEGLARTIAWYRANGHL